MNWIARLSRRWTDFGVQTSSRLPLVLGVTALSVVGSSLWPIGAAHAEGTREFYAPGTGARAVFQFRGPAGSTTNRNAMFVYARAGETIHLGSSTLATAGGANLANIVVIGPTTQTVPNFAQLENGPWARNCRADQPGQGAISTRAQEQAGPAALAAGGYSSCTLTVTQEGLYQVAFWGQAGPAAPNQIDSSATATSIGTLCASESCNRIGPRAWDITVAAGGAAQPGRVWMNALEIYTGLNGAPFRVNGAFRVQTRDGLTYEVETNTLDPNGAVFFSNNRGYRAAATDAAAYTSVFPGEVSSGAFRVHGPLSVDTSSDWINRIFFNAPSSVALGALSTLVGYATTPQTPQITNLRVEGIEGTPGAAGTFPMGGVIRFNSNLSATLTIVLDLNGNGVYGDANDRAIQGSVQQGTNSIVWDGRDALGNPVPAGVSVINLQTTFARGEIHFPVQDAENNVSGLIIRRGAAEVQQFWDDRRVTTTANGGTCTANCGPQGGVPAPLRNLTGGAGARHIWGNDGGNGSAFGDEKNLDTWTFQTLPPQVLQLLLRQADFQITKSTTATQATPGAALSYTINVRNAGPSGATGVQLSEPVPTGLQNVTWTCTVVATGTGGPTACPAASGNGAISATFDLANGASLQFTVTGTVAATATGSVTNIATLTRPNDFTDRNDGGGAPYDPAAIGVANNNRTEVATVTVPVAPADIQAVTTLPANAIAGQPVTVTGTCTSAGPSPAFTPTCALTGLPAGATQTCAPSPVPNPLPVGQAITCTSTFNAPATGTIAVTTTATTSSAETNTTNNTDTKSVAVTGQADMAAAISGLPSNPVAGSTATGTVTCTNNGPSPAAAPTCNVASTPPGATVSCVPNPAPNPLPVGGTITCSVSFTVPPSGGVTITATAGSTTADPNAANNSAQASTNVVPQADMAASTTVPANVSAGQSVTVSGTCTNNGPSVATAPTCALSGLPPGATQTCTPSPAPNPLPVNGVITCTSTFTAPAAGPLNITTTAGTSTADPQPTNNTDTDPIPIAPRADMAAAVSGFPANPPAGSTVSGTVTCTNNGPSVATAATCDVGGLPPGATVSCAPASPAASLAVGSAISCAVSYPAPASGSVTVTGTAGSSLTDPVAGNNTAQATSAVAPRADMVASTTVPPSAIAGQPVTVSGTCSNDGPSPAAAPTCALSGLPVGATQTCTPSPAPNPLPVGQTITCTSTFNAPTTGSLNITTTAGTSTTDPVASNNTSTRPLTVTQQADMVAATSGFPASANAGDTITGTVTCTNNGPSPATGATCSVTSVPSGASIICTPNPVPDPLAVGGSISCAVSYVAPANGAPLTITGTAGSNLPDPNSSNNTAQATTNTVPLVDLVATISAPATVVAGQSVTVTGTCTNNGPSDAISAVCEITGLPPGASTVCTPSPVPDPLPNGTAISCTATFTAPDSGPITARTTTRSLTAESNTTNNSASATLNVTPQADMQATVTGLPANPPAGSTVTGTVTCTNNGPSLASAATCTPGGLPAGAVVVCSPPGPSVNLSVGAAISCNFSFTAPAGGGTITVTGVAGSATADPVPANNNASASTSVALRADMQARITGLPANAPAGSTVTATATCTNAGPSPAAAPTCVVTGLPAGATSTCTPNPAPNPLPVGGAISCAISFAAPATGAVTAVVTAGTSTQDAVPGNNAASQTLTSSPVADMQAATSGFPASASAGQTVAGTVTCTNNGPSPAPNATCGVSGVPAGSTIACTPAPVPNPLPVGQSISCAVSYTAAASGAVTVSARAGSTATDPQPSNDNVAVVVPVIDAVNDSSPTPVNGRTGGVGIANVLSNDTLNGSPVSLATVTLRQTATSNPNVTLDPTTGAVNVAPGTPAGTYTVTYEICTRTSPPACDTAVATVVVNAAPIDAVNDPQVIVGPAGATVNLLGNDTLGGAPMQVAAVLPTLTNNGGISGLTLGADGNLVIPPNTPPGNYTVTYQICERLNPTNCDTATVPVVVQGPLTGSVWLDNGAGGSGANNRQRNPGEPGLAGWIVEVVFPPGSPQAGQIATVIGGQPATAVTDANGQYTVPGLPPGNYQVRFRAPAGAGGTGAIYGTPVNGETGTAQPGSTVNPATRTLDITMPAGAGLAQQSLPLDPSGTIYDSVSRQPVPGATVTLIGPNGQPVPNDQLLPGQQGQTVLGTGPAAGSYRFDLLPTAPPGTYSIRVTAPTGYTFQSSVLPPAANAGTPGSGGLCPGAVAGGSCPVQPQSTPPAGGASTLYFLALVLAPGSSPNIVNNHIPLDPANTAVLAIVKSADKSEAEVGDPVRYTIRVRNLATAGAIPAVRVIDRLPLGFRYVPRTTRGQGTPPVTLPEPAGSPGPELTFDIGSIPAGGEVTFTYFVRIGVTAVDGDGINRAFAQSGGIRSLTAQARVRVRGGVFGAESCVVGKVFADCGAGGVGFGNGNGVQDEGEPGIPGVRLYLQDGTWVITDSEGKYSLCGLAPRTHVIKVDPVTLPPGARLGVTANRNAGDPGSLFVDLKNGSLHRADFRDMSCNRSVFDEIKRRRDAAPKAEGEDVNRPRIEGQGRPGSGLGLPTDNPGNTTGATDVPAQPRKEGRP